MSAQLQDDDSALPTPAATALEVTRGRRAAWRERAAQSHAQWTARDLAWATRMNHLAAQPLALVPLVLASRMGDGGLWYAAKASLALLGDSEARLCATCMALAGLLCVTLYGWLKRLIARPRPYVR
ncbi:MAG: hypothetical protein ING59_19240 [Burkholderiales bacterium]|jgi:undecaprenyl-diphosphatase|nr:hypothetical protein [Burkholderiales bacterium]